MAWTNIKCSKGHTHRVYLQEKDEECAIACAAMIIQRITGTEMTLSDLRDKSQDIKGGYRPSVRDAGGLEGGQVAQRAMMASLFTDGLGSKYTGTLTIDNLPTLLQNHGVASAAAATAASGDALRNALKNVTARTPYVIRVRWANGGGHAVLVDRHTHNHFSKDEFCVCDPGGGVFVKTLVPDGSTATGDRTNIAYDVTYPSVAMSGYFKKGYVLT